MLTYADECWRRADDYRCGCHVYSLLVLKYLSVGTKISDEQDEGRNKTISKLHTILGVCVSRRCIFKERSVQCYMLNRAGAQKVIEDDGCNKTICKQLCVVKHVSSR